MGTNHALTTLSKLNLGTHLSQKCSEGLKVEELEEREGGRSDGGSRRCHHTPLLPSCHTVARNLAPPAGQPTVGGTPTTVPDGGRNSCRCGGAAPYVYFSNFF
jgi:hypothetical protein